MSNISTEFHNKIAADKIVGRDSANAFIKLAGLDAAKRAASAAELSNEAARADYGHWCGWIDACLAYRGY